MALILSEKKKKNDSDVPSICKIIDGNCNCVKWVFGNLEYTLECFGL